MGEFIKPLPSADERLRIELARHFALTAEHELRLIQWQTSLLYQLALTLLEGYDKNLADTVKKLEEITKDVVNYSVKTPNVEL